MLLTTEQRKSIKVDRLGVRFFADLLHDTALPAFLKDPSIRRPLFQVFTLGIIVLDYLTGPAVRFPAFYALPIMLFAWYDGFRWGVVSSVLVLGVRFSMEQFIWPNVPWSMQDSLANMLSNLAMVTVMTWFASRAGMLTRQVRLLAGLLPICANCHNLRTEQNRWIRLEEFFEQRTEAIFSHGICPACEQKFDDGDRRRATELTSQH